jgi:ABC-2 type transport system permease protein
MKRMLDFYLTTMKIAVQEQFQYRVAQYFYMIGMIAEPVIYLVVWSTVAEAQGGSVGGYTPGGFASYYIVWTLVRNMNIVFTPYGWEWRIQRGRLSEELLRPIHPLHTDLAYFAGMKIVVIVLWLPLAAFLAWIFKPTLNPTWVQVVVFFLAVWGAYLIRTMLLSLLGMITFWTTRVGAIYELFFAVELVLSGRMVPMSLMPVGVQQVATYLPFQWTFSFPIEALVGQLSLQALLFGLAMQVFWILFGVLWVRIVWRLAIRRYSAVGN